MSVIVAHELTQRYGSEVALDAVDLALDQGEHLAVLGDNGAGKTTLLRILATAARPTSGRLQIFGLDAVREYFRLLYFLKGETALDAARLGGELFPILGRIREIPEICNIFCATANPVEVILAETGQGRGILGVIDGSSPKGIESANDREWRHGLLRKIGYKR